MPTHEGRSCWSVANLLSIPYRSLNSLAVRSRRIFFKFLETYSNKNKNLKNYKNESIFFTLNIKKLSICLKLIIFFSLNIKKLSICLKLIILRVILDYLRAYWLPKWLYLFQNLKFHLVISQVLNKNLLIFVELSVCGVKFPVKIFYCLS